MNTLHEFIDRQISCNRGKNLFSNQCKRTLELEESFYSFFMQIDEIEDVQFKKLLDYTVNQVITELCRINQYYNFDFNSKSELKNIYSDFIIALKANKKSIPDMVEDHERILKSWLYKTNPFSYSIYKNKEAFIDPITCSEYSAQIQLSVLRIDINKLKNPILDIGCGKNAYLVEYLRNKGYDCYGIDRFCNSNPYISDMNWLEYDYEEGKWGTIISNLGFSNHFVHHHLREDGNYIDYAKTYMKILRSLKYEGTFYYAPDLSFIENLLDRKEYLIDNYCIDNIGYSATIIKKIGRDT